MTLPAHTPPHQTLTPPCGKPRHRSPHTPEGQFSNPHVTMARGHPLSAEVEEEPCNCVSRAHTPPPDLTGLHQPSHNRNDTPRVARHSARSTLNSGHQDSNQHRRPGKSSKPSAWTPRSSPSPSPGPRWFYRYRARPGTRHQLAKPGRERQRPHPGFGRARSSVIVRERLCPTVGIGLRPLSGRNTPPPGRDRSPAAPLGGPDRTCQAVDPHRGACLVFTYQPELI